MAVTVKLPTILRKHAAGEAKVGADGATLRDVLSDLEGKYPGITKNVLAEDGGLHRFINVYVNEDNTLPRLPRDRGRRRRHGLDPPGRRRRLLTRPSRSPCRTTEVARPMQ
jgi:molybdopterin converting factor small subunit